MANEHDVGGSNYIKRAGRHLSWCSYCSCPLLRSSSKVEILYCSSRYHGQTFSRLNELTTIPGSHPSRPASAEVQWPKRIVRILHSDPPNSDSLTPRRNLRTPSSTSSVVSLPHVSNQMSISSATYARNTPMTSWVMSINHSRPSGTRIKGGSSWDATIIETAIPSGGLGDLPIMFSVD